MKVPAEYETPRGLESSSNSSHPSEAGLGVDARDPPDVGERHPLDEAHGVVDPGDQVLLEALLPEEPDDGAGVVLSEVGQVSGP